VGVIPVFSIPPADCKKLYIYSQHLPSREGKLKGTIQSRTKHEGSPRSSPAMRDLRRGGAFWRIRVIGNSYMSKEKKHRMSRLYFFYFSPMSPRFPSSLKKRVTETSASFVCSWYFLANHRITCFTERSPLNCSQTAVPSSSSWSFFLMGVLSFLPNRLAIRSIQGRISRG
jgi:hypothetical protein